MSVRAVNRRERGAFRVLLDLLIIVVAVSALVWGTSTYLITGYFIPSASMESTLNIGDRIFATKTGLDIKDIKRGDIIIFEDDGDWLKGEGLSDGFLIKRVIGLPGDTVSCCDALGRLQINGVSINEPYVKYGEAPSEETFTTTVPKDSLWVMGDNRDESNDSRYQKNPFVNISSVVAKAFYVYYPFSKQHKLEDYSSVFAGVPDRDYWK